MIAHALEARFRSPERPGRYKVEQGPVLVSIIVVLLCAFSCVSVARHPQPAPGYEFVVPAGL